MRRFVRLLFTNWARSRDRPILAIVRIHLGFQTGSKMFDRSCGISISKLTFQDPDVSTYGTEVAAAGNRFPLTRIYGPQTRLQDPQRYAPSSARASDQVHPASYLAGRSLTEVLSFLSTTTACSNA
jgi:hypothetical protein